MARFCSNCGKEIDENAYICVNCGTRVLENNQVTKDTFNDKGGFLWGLFGASAPLAGLILFIMWKNKRPKTAKAAGIGALFYLIFYIIIIVLVLVLVFGFEINDSYDDYYYDYYDYYDYGYKHKFE